MNNEWLKRKPQIYQQNNPYMEHYGMYYITRDEFSNVVYLHNDGTWRSSLYSYGLGGYSGYFKSYREAEEAIENEKLLVRKK